MKKLLTAIFIALISVPGFAMTESAKNEITKALTGDYQAMRNVAFSMKNASFGHDRNPIAGCAFRRLILLVHSEKADSVDYNNEYIDCRALSLAENERSWKTTITLLPEILSETNK
ncbi:hypothetical protein CEP49_06660 [Mergibacter septicus]|uniref:hypothetical protein n=1 Tax=Mergibacter septicus TaxID=221402 RepID=UPI0011790710|nr:hypothetical protein [Mergibacter septicus]AWX14252.1 hypothetical protein CEP49_06660 [Mergibacter septicus]